MLYLQAWNTPQAKRSALQDRADSLATLRIIARTPYNADTLAKFIPSGPTFYLSAKSEDLTMDTPMFKQSDNDVLVRFNSYGEIEVIFSRILTKEQTRLFNNGTFNLQGILDVKPISSTIPSDHTGFKFMLMGFEAINAMRHRDSIASYARQFAESLLPEVKQGDLFSMETVNPDAGKQVSMF